VDDPADMQADMGTRFSAAGTGSKTDTEAYFRKRAEAERAAARDAATDAARRAHQELADEYAALLRRK
jgi:hypothetical protein